MGDSGKTIIQQLGAFVANLDRISERVNERATTCFVYNVGISFAMHDKGASRAAEQLAVALHGVAPATGGAVMLASGQRGPLAGAAFANGVIFGAGGRGDTLGTIHIGQSILPALLALTEARDIPSARLLPAMVAGYEVGGRLDRAYGEEVARAGFRSTALFGAIAAAAACAALLGLDAVRAAHAIGLATSMTGGLLQPFSDGSDEPRWQPSRGVTLGLFAALAAEQGVRGAHRGLDGTFGLVRATTRRDAVPGEITADLGDEWMIEQVTFKPFPVCAFTQTPVYAGLALREKLDGRQIDELVVRLNPREAAYAGLDNIGPFKTPVEVMMSAPFAVVHGLVTGRSVDMPAILTLGEDEKIKSSLRTARLVTDADVPPLSTIIDATLADGTMITHRQMMTPASYRFGRDDVRTMVRDTIAGLPGPAAAQARFDRFEASIVGGVSAADVSVLFLS